MSFIVVAKFRAKPDSIEKLTALVKQTAEQSWQEPGLIKYIIVADPTQPELITLIEFFNSEADYLSHRESTHLARFRDQVGDLIAEPAEVVRGVPAFAALNPKAGIN